MKEMSGFFGWIFRATFTWFCLVTGLWVARAVYVNAIRTHIVQ